MTRDRIAPSVHIDEPGWYGDTFIEGRDDVARRERYAPVTVTEHGHYGFLHDVGVCAATGRQGVPIEVEHLSGNEFSMGKVAGGMSQKPHFVWCIPLGQDLHDLKTSRAGYRDAFRRMNWPIEDIRSGPLPVALALVAFSAMGDVEGARRWLIDCAVQRAAG